MTQPAPRQYSNTAVNTTLTSAVFGPTSTSMSVASNVGYPTTFPFTIRINPGAANEEIVDVTAGAGTVAQPWTVVRGRDGTTPQSWNQGTAISHGFSARDFADIQAAMVSAQGLISNALPIGTILMWYGAFDNQPGSINNIPSKFKLCDGKSYRMADGQEVTPGTVGSVATPNLTSRFLYGAGVGTGAKSVGTFGGSNALTSALMPSHTHPISSDSHTHSVYHGSHNHNLWNRAAGAVSSGGSYNVPTTASGVPVSNAYTAGGSGSDHTHDADSPAHTHGGATQATGLVSPTENNMPAYFAIAYIMRVAP